MLLVLLSVFTFFAGVLLAIAWPISPPILVYFLPLFLYRFNGRLALLAFSLFLGFWRVQLYEWQVPSEPLLGYQSLEGQIVEEIDRRLDHQKITVQTEYGRVLVTVSLYEELSYGDRIELSGDFQTPSEDIDGFSYANYLARYRIWMVLYDARVHLIEPSNMSFRGLLYAFKQRLEGRLNQLFFEPEASFAAGLLLGSRKGMPTILADAFQVVGLTHIVAISGYNITLVIAGVFLLLGFLPLRMRIAVSILCIFVFVLLVGASAAVVRAGIMGAVTLWALYTGRKSQVFFALLWSALVMVLWNPYILVYDVGFQLSFASTLGLLLFVPILETVIPPFKRFALLREALLLTLAAQIATLPFMALHFGQFSLISPLANVLVAPFLPLAMLFAALALILGKPAALLAMVHLKVVEWVALLLAQLPFISLPLSFSIWEFSLLCFLLLLWALSFYKSIWVRAFFREGEGVF